MLMIKAAWNYRDFILSSIKAEIKGKYAGSKLGIFWVVLHPLAHAAVLAIVLSQLLGSRLSGIDSDYAYAIYLLSGVVAWNFFADTVGSSVSMFRDRANLLKKVNFPRICIPLIVAGASIINHVLFLSIVIAIVWALGISPGLSLWVIPLAFILILGMAIAIGLTLSVFDVFNRDVGNFWSVVVQFWFWLTPIVYAPEVLPEAISAILIHNPVYPMILSYQHAIAYGDVPNLMLLVKSSLITLFLLVFSFFLYLRSSSDVVDAL